MAVGGEYFLSKAVQLYCGMEYRSFTVEDGEDWVYYSSGTIGYSRLNEANWSARSFTAGLHYYF